MQARARGACCERFGVLPRGVLRGAVPFETSTGAPPGCCEELVAGSDRSK